MSKLQWLLIADLNGVVRVRKSCTSGKLSCGSGDYRGKRGVGLRRMDVQVQVGIEALRISPVLRPRSARRIYG
jgi:hypothetical protein